MANCTTCGTCQQDCQCIPAGLTTPSYCPADSPNCPTPSPCAETFDSQCIIYTGVNLTCLGVEEGDNLQTVIQAIADKLDPFLCLECASLVVPANGATDLPYTQTLTWNAVPGATSYNVYFGTNPVNPPQVATGQVATTWTSPTPLAENTSYYWKVVPVNSSGSAQNCPVYTFKTKQNLCVNPLTQFLENTYIIASKGGEPDPRNFVTAITNTLEDGEILTNCNLCCPDCEQTNRYVLASAGTYADFYSSVYGVNCPPVCCTEVAAALTAMSNPGPSTGTSLSEAFAATPPVTNCCGTNFSECVQALKNESNPLSGVFLNDGVAEESTISGSTTLCVILDFLNGLPVSFTDQDKADVFSALLNAGIVVDCRPEGTIIAGVNTYLNYLGNVQDGCLCYVPCTIVN